MRVGRNDCAHFDDFAALCDEKFFGVSDSLFIFQIFFLLGWACELLLLWKEFVKLVEDLHLGIA